MQIPKRTSFLALIAFIYACAVAGTPAQARFAGYVTGYEGAAQNYTIVREGRVLPVGYMTPVHVGDLIQTGQSGRLKLGLTDRSTPTICGVRAFGRQCAHRAPFRVKVRSSAFREVSRNLLDQIGQTLSRVQEIEVTAVGRGDGVSTSPFSIAIPGLADGAARIAARPRRFGVAWNGGRAPFSVAVVGSDGTTVVRETGIRAQELLISSRLVDFAPGEYGIVIEDADQRRVSGKFTAISPVRRQDHTSAPVPDFLDVDASDLVQLGWFFERLNNENAFEAYLLIVPLTANSKRHPGAESLKDWILR